MDKQSKIYVAGHAGMVGSAIVRSLKNKGYTNIIGKTIEELDLTRQAEVEDFFCSEKPKYVIIAAAKVGGIAATVKYPAEFLIENLQIQNNIFTCSFKAGVKKLLFISSACIYPCDAKQPIDEESLLTGPLEPTNESYALAKIAGLKACEYYHKEHGAGFMSGIPCNLYGYNDSFSATRSNLIPSLIRKFHSAKVNGLGNVVVWGTGNAYRELLFADDMADACIFLMENCDSGDFYNIGYGEDFTILQIAQMVKKVVGFEGEIVTDPTKPEGMFRKIVDSSKLNALGWKPKTSIEKGLKLTYQWFLENVKDKDELFT